MSKDYPITNCNSHGILFSSMPGECRDLRPLQAFPQKAISYSGDFTVVPSCTIIRQLPKFVQRFWFEKCLSSKKVLLGLLHATKFSQYYIILFIKRKTCYQVSLVVVGASSRPDDPGSNPGPTTEFGSLAPGDWAVISGAEPLWSYLLKISLCSIYACK